METLFSTPPPDGTNHSRLTIPPHLGEKFRSILVRKLEQCFSTACTATSVDQLQTALVKGQTVDAVFTLMSQELQADVSRVETVVRQAVTETLNAHAERLRKAREHHEAYLLPPPNSRAVFYESLAKELSAEKSAVLSRVDASWRHDQFGNPLDLPDEELWLHFLDFHLEKLDRNNVDSLLFKAINTPNGKEDQGKPSSALSALIYKGLSGANFALYRAEEQEEGEPGVDHPASVKKDNRELQNMDEFFKIRLYLELKRYTEEKWGDLDKRLQMESLQAYLASSSVAESKVQSFLKSSPGEGKPPVWQIAESEDESADDQLLLNIFGDDLTRLPELKSHLSSIKRRVELMVHRAELIPYAVRALLNNPHARSLEKDHVADLLKTALHLSLDSDYQLEVSVGYGGTQDELQARLPAHALAATHLVEQVLKFQDRMTSEFAKKSRKPPCITPPRLRLFSAHRPSTRSNGFNLATVETRAKEILNFTFAYLERFHPEVADCTVCELDSDEVYPTELEEMLVEKLTSANGRMGKTMETIYRMGLNNGDHELSADAKRESDRYTAIHPLVFRDIITSDHPNGFVTYRTGRRVNASKPPDAVFTFGGLPEKRFAHVRNILTNAVTSDSTLSPQFSKPHRVLFLQHAGTKPAYYADGEGDLPLSTVSKENDHETLSRNVRNELKMIEKDTGSWEGYVDFVEKTMKGVSQSLVY